MKESEEFSFETSDETCCLAGRVVQKAAHMCFKKMFATALFVPCESTFGHAPFRQIIKQSEKRSERFTYKSLSIITFILCSKAHNSCNAIRRISPKVICLYRKRKEFLFWKKFQNLRFTFFGVKSPLASTLLCPTLAPLRVFHP